MKIEIIALGDRMPEWVTAGFTEYQIRLKPLCKFSCVEIPLITRSKTANLSQIMQQEGEKILRHITNDDFVIALDTAGKEFTNVQFTEKFQQWIGTGKNLKFIIGGPEGLPNACVVRADIRWCLSKLTLPHPLVRIMLAEQLYRTFSMLRGHPYHK